MLKTKTDRMPSWFLVVDIGLLLILGGVPSVTALDCPADIVFVLDDSTSIQTRGYENWVDVKDFVKDVIQAIYREDTKMTRFGAITFSTTSQTEFLLGKHDNLIDLLKAVDDIPWTSGDTNIYSAIKRLRRFFKGNRENVTKIAIVVTDGQSNIDADKTAWEAAAARDEGVEFIAVGITREINLKELESIAGEQGQIMTVLDFQELLEQVTDVAKTACHLDSIDPILPDLPDGPTDCQADIAFMLDDSTSITRYSRDWRNTLEFVDKFLRSISIAKNDTRIAAGTFSDSASVEFYLDEHYTYNDIKDAFYKIKITTGDTNIFSAIRALRTRLFNNNRGDRSGVKNIGIILTDGHSNKDADKTKHEADLARAEGIEIIAVGITRQIDISELKSIALTSDHVITVLNFFDLLAVVNGVLLRACHLSTAVPTSSTTSPSTATSSTTAAGTSPTTTTTTTTRTKEPTSHTTQTTATTTTPDIYCAADIVFMLDDSTSVSRDEDNWPNMLEFVNDFLQRISIGRNLTRVAVLTFHDSARTQFYLNDYFTTEELTKAVDKIKLRGGDTSIYSALRKATTDILRASRGDRKGAKNIGVIVTDGQSNKDATRTKAAAEEARKEGLEIIAVGISSSVDLGELEMVAGDKKNVISVMDFEDLLSIATDIIQQACQPTTTVATTTTTPTTTTTTPTTTPTTTTEKTTTPTTTTTTEPTTTTRTTTTTVSTTTTQTTNLPTTTTTTATTSNLPTIGNTSPSTSSTTKDCRADIVFILDDSTSIDRSQQWSSILAFVENFLSAVTVGVEDTRVAIITFSHSAEVEFYLDDKFDNVTAALYAIKVSGGETSIFSGLYLARTEVFSRRRGDRPDAKNIIILVTDGQSNHEASRARTEAELARDEEIEIYCVGVTDAVDSQELLVIANREENVLFAPDYVQFLYLVDPLVTKTCGYNPDIERDIMEGCSLDLAFLIDSSGSIRDANKPGQDNWKLVKSFLNEFVDNLGELAVDGGRTRVAAIRFSTHAHLEFDLNKYVGDREGLRQAIDKIPYDGHKTNTPAAFKLAEERVYEPYYGDRKNAPNVVIIITDGKPETRPKVFAVEETVRASKRLQRKGVKVYAVGVTNESVKNKISEETLKRISSFQNYWIASDFSSLMSIISDIPKKACFEVKRKHGLI